MSKNRRNFLMYLGSALVAPKFVSANISYKEIDVSLDLVAIYEAVNRERKRRGLRALKVNNKLENAALKFSKKLDKKKYGMGEGRVAFKAHGANAATEVKSRARRSGYKVRIIGETVGYFQNPERAVPGWMNSPSHRAILLHPKMIEMGLGTSGKVYVLMVGKSKNG